MSKQHRDNFRLRRCYHRTLLLQQCYNVDTKLFYHLQTSIRGWYNVEKTYSYDKLQRYPVKNSRSISAVPLRAFRSTNSRQEQRFWQRSSRNDRFGATNCCLNLLPRCCNGSGSLPCPSIEFPLNCSHTSDGCSVLRLCHPWPLVELLLKYCLHVRISPQQCVALTIIMKLTAILNNVQIICTSISAVN